jgi:cytochrome d ubiquinol oxidase subunit II
MTLATLLALVLGLSLTAYAALAGTDFGAGILELASRGDEDQREEIAAGIGPLWEANHVWLILAITVMFSAFPTAFAAVGTTLMAPLTVALLAIVLRGAALGARPEPGSPGRKGLSALFGVSSVLAPFAFGIAAAGVAQVSTGGAAASATFPLRSVPWFDAFSIVTGLLAVALCAHLGSSFMAARLGRAGDRARAAVFARRGIWTGIALAGLGDLTVAVAIWKVPALAHRLEGRALPIVLVWQIATIGSPFALAAGRAVLARSAALISAATLIWGWFVAQWPHLIGPRLTVHLAAATGPALTAVAIAFALVLIAVLPAVALLYSLFRRPSPEMTA